LWFLTRKSNLILLFHGLLGALNCGDEPAIEYFASKVLFDKFTLNSSYASSLKLLDMGLSSLVGVQLYFSRKFKALRTYSEGLHGHILTRTPWVAQVWAIFRKGPRATIRWVHENVLSTQEAQDVKELDPLRNLDHKHIFTMDNPELIEYYQQVHGPSLTQQYISLYYEHIVQRIDTGVNGVMFAIHKGYTNWQEGESIALRYKRQDIAALMRKLAQTKS